MMSNHLRIMIDRELTETDRRKADAYDSPQRRYYDRLAKQQSDMTNDYGTAEFAKRQSSGAQNAILTPEQRYLKRLAIAQKIAEDARRRNTPVCQCDGCKMDRALPAVLRIIEHAKRRDA